MLCVVSTPAFAQQIRTDNSLSTTVVVDALDFTIDGGDRVGDNLFHSFSEFSVPTAGAAIFTNPIDVTNIISRVTGGSISSIDGLIKANGTANLFLINPAGLIFGSDAQLDIGGSFVGSSAESLRFAGSTEFLATTLAPTSQLMINVPTGLQLGASSQDILIQDTGYTTSTTLPLTVDNSSSLGVSPANTIALIGSNVLLKGGGLFAPAGHIELGGVRTGVVSMNPDFTDFDYTDVSQFGDIELLSQSLVNTSGLFVLPAGNPLDFSSQGGSTQIVGQHLSVQNDSKIVTQNFGDLSFGSVYIDIRDTVELSESGTGLSGIFTTNFGEAGGGDIAISAQHLHLDGDADISTDTFGNGNSGKVIITVPNTIRFRPSTGIQPGFSNIETASFGTGTAGDIEIGSIAFPTGSLEIIGGSPSALSESIGVVSQTADPGKGGNVQVFADSILLLDGGSISAATLGQGAGGNVEITADVVEVIGVAPFTLVPSIIAAAATATGDAGNVMLTTETLLVRDGGRIDSSTLAFGDAGSITVTASERIDVRGTVPDSVNPSLIISSANVVDPDLRAFFASVGSPLPQIPTGASGDVTVSTPNLAVEEGAQITVRNDGTGNAGKLTLNADATYISSQAGITASTLQGSGGNLDLNLRDVLLLRRGSRLSAEAGGTGDGGNIDIATPFLLALENSDIVANAFQGTGGDVSISAQSVLGTTFRDRLTPQSDITASSQFGTNGTVTLDTPTVTPSSDAVELPSALANLDQRVAAGCSQQQGNQFITSGRGGVPTNPTSSIESNRLWQDVRILRELSGHQVDARRSPSDQQTGLEPNRIQEAVGWQQSQAGQIELIATNSFLSSEVSMPSCLANHKL
ncbi:MAG: S-layer family protein [Cyanobacteria bacterium P01_D01_bin.1]